MGRPPASARVDSRARILAAATAEFAARGLAGASVDRIARKARLNKAMLYYHFDSKDGLYREVIRSTFEAVGARAAAIAASDATAAAKIAAFVRAVVEEAGRRPEFPRVMMRELSEVGQHLGPDEMRALIRIPESFFAIQREGVAAGELRPAHPLIAYFSVLGPILLVLASEPARQRITKLIGRSLPELSRDQLVTEAQSLALALLAHPSAAPPVPLPGDRHASPEPAAPPPPPPRAGHRPRRRMP
jgi:TetR/AcrR family transcriptional regulator